MTFEEIKQKINHKDYHPLYLFYGDEPYYIDQLLTFCENKLMDEASRAFNQVTLYGKEADARVIIDELTQFPMMAKHRVVIVKEAQHLRNFQDLFPIIERPVPHGILVLGFTTGKLDKRTKAGKALIKNAVVFHSKPLYDNQIGPWIRNYAKEQHMVIDHDTAELLAEYLGNDLKKISNELEKLKLNTPQGNKVTAEQVKDQIGISKEFNVFELQKALGSNDRLKARVIVKYISENSKSNPIQLTISSLYSYFTKVLIALQNRGKSDNELMKLLGLGSPYFVKDYKTAIRHFDGPKLRAILVKLREMDLKSKGLENRSAADGELLSDLVHFILH